MKKTVVYFVRHADSPYIPGQERTRGLSEKGQRDARRVCAILQQEQIDVFVSSPYERAIQTIKAAAGNSEMIQYEDLRERSIGNSREHSFRESKRMAYEDFDHSFPEGESSRSAQQRAVATFLQLLVRHEGQKIAIGTHGDIMTLMMNHFDPAYHFEFWESTSMPDIYKLEFEGTRLIEVTRVWK